MSLNRCFLVYVCESVNGLPEYIMLSMLKNKLASGALLPELTTMAGLCASFQRDIASAIAFRLGPEE